MMGYDSPAVSGMVLRELTDRDRGQPAFRPCCRCAPHLHQCEGTADTESGRPFPYPDGTIFADDIHEFSAKDGASLEGAKEFMTVMVKEAKKYARTGGDSRCGLRATPGHHKCRILPTPSKLA